jgi:hypothetical protein
MPKDPAYKKARLSVAFNSYTPPHTYTGTLWAPVRLRPSAHPELHLFVEHQYG